MCKLRKSFYCSDFNLSQRFTRYEVVVGEKFKSNSNKIGWPANHERLDQLHDLLLLPQFQRLADLGDCLQQPRILEGHLRQVQTIWLPSCGKRPRRQWRQESDEALSGVLWWGTGICASRSRWHSRYRMSGYRTTCCWTDGALVQSGECTASSMTLISGKRCLLYRIGQKFVQEF